MENNLTNIAFFGKLKRGQVFYCLDKFHILYKGHPNVELYKYGLSALKMAEYLNSGKPIIHAVNIKNDPVVLSESGLSTPPEDEEALKSAILKLKNDKELYLKLSNNGKEYIKENFSEEKIEQKLKKAIDEVLKIKI